MTLPLSVVIPVHNDRPHLVRLLARLGALGLADRAIVVDDASDDPVEAGALADAAGIGPETLTVLRQPERRGAGAARNLGLSRVETGHMLFLDADDLPTRELRGLLADLEGRRFDFCLFQHHDSRMDQDRIWGQMPFDQTHWEAAGAVLGALSEVRPDAARHLVRIANYPWNKVYRAAFLRENAIGCTESLVHNDIELHWRSFLAAQTVLASDRVGVVHFVSPGGGRLTNRTGPERLEIFDPLERIAAEIEARGGAFALPFHAFAIGLFDWIAGNLDAGHHDRLADLVRAFVEGHVPPGLLAEIRSGNPERTDRVLARAGLG